MAWWDNPLLQFIAPSNPNVQAAAADQMQVRQGERYKGLLREFEGSEQVGIQGPVQPGQDQLGSYERRGYKDPMTGLLGNAPPAEFFTRAAGLPGYQQLAAGAQSQAGAMERQQQNQNWSQNNLTLAENMRQASMDQQNSWERTRADSNDQFARTGITAYQQQQIDQDKARTGLQGQTVAQGWANLQVNQQRQQAEIDQRNLAARFPALGLQGQQQVDFRTGLNNLDNAAGAAAATIDYMQNRQAGSAVYDPSQAAVIGTQWQGAMLPYLQQRFRAGAMQEGEQKLFTKLAGDPTNWVNMSGKDLAVIRMWQQDIDRTRGQQYGMLGQRAPVIDRGASASAKSETNVRREDYEPVTSQTVRGKIRGAQ